MCSLEIESSLTSSESSMDQRPNSTNTTNTASLELRKRSSSYCVDQPSKMSRSELVSDIIDLN
ncbi:hypothetical protein Ahy_B10g101977 isoform B [Arachis hypogaea]|uniref:Uncharacterized protein n=1 Tax=Arachis hypogaea TaxID=3818 RepID=A0A444X0Z9_ARAHY|nr:hypothetical protein Ahy_B10g101977 isoform B [Arachis hypogaea]